MSVLFTDLDNTLIYSHNREIKGPKLVIEYIDGRKQSFITKFTYDFLLSVDWLSVVPVTTRTENQFMRLQCPADFNFNYSIICNGGKLLFNGKEDKAWTEETHSIAEKNYDGLKDATEQLIQLCKNETVYRPEEYMRYVKCDDPESVYDFLSKRIDTSKVIVQRDGRKLYLFTKGITKGDAIERFLKSHDYGTVLAAGDGLLDISMLNKADYAFSGQDISELVKNKNNIKIKERVISDIMFITINEMHNKGII